MMHPLWVEGMFGLGDNLYQRAVLREVIKSRVVYLSTPWSQLYSDLAVRCVRPRTTLRTQAKNADRPARWHNLPNLVDHRRWHYVNRNGTMLEALCADIGVRTDAIDFSGPPAPRLDREPYIVVRPVTERTEWRAGSRSPRPEYIALAAQMLRRHYRIISVADICPPHEIAVGPLPTADETYHRGEIQFENLLALVANAAAVVGGVGWLAPMAVAYQVPMFLIFGGWGLHNGPGRIFDRRMNTELIHQSIPQRFCMCGSRDHACDKRIYDIRTQLESWIVELATHRETAMAARTRDRMVSGDGATLRSGVLGALPAV